jgi:hypothetical protein
MPHTARPRCTGSRHVPPPPRRSIRRCARHSRRVRSRGRSAQDRAAGKPAAPTPHPRWRGGQAIGATSPAGSAGCQHTARPPRRRRTRARQPVPRARCRDAPAGSRKHAARLPAARHPSPDPPRPRCGRTPARSLPADGAAWGGRRSGEASWAVPTSCVCRSRRPGSRRCAPSVSLVALPLSWRFILRRVKG